jgi:Zn-dependent protease/CBS domain-containing protein
MRWSLRILTVSGIGIYVHITFLILVAWIGAIFFQSGGAVHAVHGILLILAVFACVVLHELGHALTAKRFGIKTKDITLLPIGGVARLERIPREPGKEFLIAIAGPLVNVVIAGLLYSVIRVALPSVSLEEVDENLLQTPGLDTFLIQLLAVNVVMVVFNMIPAFPMDGGRILRSALASVMDYATATRIAAFIGQSVAVVMGIFAIYKPLPLLFIVAVFVFLGAAGEAAAVQLRATFQGLTTATGMMRSFRSLEKGDTLGRAVQLLLEGNQADFPIIEDGKVTGVLTRRQLVASLKEKGVETPVADVPLAKVEPVEAGAPLYRTHEEMARQGVSSLPVLENGSLVGWITSENIAEVAMVREALAHRGASRPPDLPRT